MRASEYYNNIVVVEQLLKKILEIVSWIDESAFEEREGGLRFYEGYEEMDDDQPEDSEQIKKLWSQLQKSLPPGFLIDSNLIRHLSFNQSRDWFDIAKKDIPKELKKVNDYKKRIILVEYLENLRPEISRVSHLVLTGEIEYALKSVYATLDTKIRQTIGAKSSEPTFVSIGRAFKEGVLKSQDNVNNDAVRNFLQGIVGYYRNNIIHKPLPVSRESIYSSLSLFALAHEAFIMIDFCIQEKL